jgi:hypothetical protein
MILVLGVWAFARALLVNSAGVSLENVALRHQLAVLQRLVGRPRLRRPKDEASVYEGGVTRRWLKVKQKGWTVEEDGWRRRIFG